MKSQLKHKHSVGDPDWGRREAGA